MIISQKYNEFSPVTITLETLEEAAIMAAIIGGTSHASRKDKVAKAYPLITENLDAEMEAYTVIYNRLHEVVCNTK